MGNYTLRRYRLSNQNICERRRMYFKFTKKLRNKKYVNSKLLGGVNIDIKFKKVLFSPRNTDLLPEIDY